VTEPRVVGDRYQLFERLGKGAMGVVYRAHDSVLDRRVAVKMMVADMAHDDRLRERFFKEARAAARLNHRHVVTIHELAEVDGDIYIVMELLDGVDLAGLMAESIRLPLSAKLSIIDQVLDGLEYAHEQAVVHRDIKPANLHLTSRGIAKILDFGIARLLSAQATGTMGVVGTPAYMSPEQALGAPVDRRTDLFALGTVTYELLSGVRPFQAETIGRLMTLIADVPHPPLGPEVPAAVSELVDRLLAKDPADRPQTAAAARAELASARESLGPGDADADEATADLSTFVLETVTARETIAPDYGPAVEPRPPTPVDGPARGGASRGLTTFALQQGRTLRERGDLAGAMRALRSVLEADPGNDAAMSELQLVERELGGSHAADVTEVASARWWTGRWPIAAAMLLVGLGGLATWSVIESKPGGDNASTAVVVGPAPDGVGSAPVESQEEAPPPAARTLAGARGGATSQVRARFEQLSRAADRQELDQDVAEELTSIRRAAEALTASGDSDEAGEIYFRGVLLLEGVFPPSVRGAPFGRSGGRGGDIRIRRAIDEYVSGLERRNVAAVRGVRPALSSFEQDLLDAPEPARVRFIPLRIQAGENEATVTARVIVERTDTQPARQDARFQFSFRRNDGRWQITAMRPVSAR